MELNQFPSLILWVLERQAHILTKSQPLSDKLLDVLREELKMVLFHKQKFKIGRVGHHKQFGAKLVPAIFYNCAFGIQVRQITASKVLKLFQGKQNSKFLLYHLLRLNWVAFQICIKIFVPKNAFLIVRSNFSLHWNF
jgi:hypothetical protein